MQLVVDVINAKKEPLACQREILKVVLSVFALEDRLFVDKLDLVGDKENYTDLEFYMLTILSMILWYD